MYEKGSTRHTHTARVQSKGTEQGVRSNWPIGRDCQSLFCCLRDSCSNTLSVYGVSCRQHAHTARVQHSKFGQVREVFQTASNSWASKNSATIRFVCVCVYGVSCKAARALSHTQQGYRVVRLVKLEIDSSSPVTPLRFLQQSVSFSSTPPISFHSLTLPVANE